MSKGYSIQDMEGLKGEAMRYDEGSVFQGVKPKGNQQTISTFKVA